MDKEYKILIVGFGSIGQRHWQNLKKLGYDKVTLFDPDNSKTEKLPHLSRLDKNTLKDFGVVFICNPTNFHKDTAIMCAEMGLHLFIEKPLSHELSNLDKLEALAERKKITTMVACNMRFHPCLSYIKDYLSERKLGDVYSISHEFGYYLPLWREADYRKNYAAKWESGGGILLDDIHEFDLLFWLNDFEEVIKTSALSNRASKLEIETDDQVSFSFIFKNKVIGRVYANYLSRSYRRNCVIIGERGNLVWCWGKNEVLLEKDGHSEIMFSAPNFDANDMYLSEVKYFMDIVAKRGRSQNDITQASQLLKVLLQNADL